MNIVTVGYDSTNYYVLETHNGTLLVDCGWHWVKWVTEVEGVSVF